MKDRGSLPGVVGLLHEDVSYEGHDVCLVGGHRLRGQGEQGPGGARQVLRRWPGQTCRAGRRGCGVQRALRARASEGAEHRRRRGGRSCAERCRKARPLRGLPAAARTSLAQPAHWPAGPARPTSVARLLMAAFSTSPPTYWYSRASRGAMPTCRAARAAADGAAQSSRRRRGPAPGRRNAGFDFMALRHRGTWPLSTACVARAARAA